MAALGWSTAWRIARRELRSSRSKFLFVVISVAVGVAALTGVRGFAAAFRQTLAVRARSILAADVSARMFQQPTAKQEARLATFTQQGIEMTPVTEMSGMATQAGKFDPLLVSLKAVEPDKYPFYGSVDLAPSMSLQQAFANNGVAVGDDLLVRLRLQVGDHLRLGQAEFVIRAVVQSEPDRLSGSFAAGPRVLLSQAELDETELLAPGSRAGQRILFHLPQQNDAAVARLKSQVEDVLPEAQVMDYHETSPAVAIALERATALLSLVSLVALVLGAVGVAMAMRAHLAERLDTIAIMKALGAQTSHILRIYFLETLALGVAGGVAGIVLGVAVQLALPLLLAKLLGISPDMHLSLASMSTGLLTGVVVTLLFTVPPLLDIRAIRPIQILRRSMEEAPVGSWRELLPRIMRRLRHAPAQAAGMLAALAGVALIATMLSGSRSVGIVFTVGMVVVLLVLMIAAALLLMLLRWLLNRTRLALPYTLRHGLANLYRPGNPSAALLSALGVGVMLLAAVYFVQHAFVNDLNIATRPNLPNVFLIDIGRSEVDPLKALLKHQPGIAGTPELVPAVASSIVAVDGVRAADLHIKNMPLRVLRSVQLTWSETLPEGTSVVDGKFWSPGETGPLLAIDEHRAQRFHLKVGSRVVFQVEDSLVDATVIAITKSDGQHAFSRADYILPKSVLVNGPTVWYGAVHVDPSRVGELQRALFMHFPTVTVINVAQAMETLRGLLLQVSLVIQFLAGFSIFAGLVILASAIAGTRYRRIREVVVLKTLGGTRKRIAGIFSVEFATLGLVAGVIGVVAANFVARSALHRMTLPWNPRIAASFAAVLITAILTVAAGWAASFRILGQKPLEVLREE